MFYIRHATLITPDQTIPDGAVLIDQGKIVELGLAADVRLPPGTRVFDADGLMLSPGFIDLQFNGAFGLDFTQNPASLWKVAEGLPRYGVTTFLPTVITCPMERVDEALAVWSQGPPPDFIGSTPLGFHLEGPWINPDKKGAHSPAHIRPPSLEAAGAWSPSNGVRMVTLAPEVPGALPVIQSLRERGVVVSAGHSMATFDQVQAGFEAGITSGTHLFNAMPPLDHRAPGVVGAILSHATVTAGLIADGIHLHPAMVRLVWRLKGPDRLALVTDAMAALGMPPGTYRLGDLDVIVNQDSARLPNGTLAGSILTLGAAVHNLVTFTSCTLAQAVTCVTRTPAQLLSLDHKGRLAPGMDADLTLFTPHLQIQVVLIAGRVVYSQLAEGLP